MVLSLVLMLVQSIAPRQARAEITCLRHGRFARSWGHSCIRMRWLTSTKILVMSRLFLRWRSPKGFKAFQSSKTCFEYSEKQIGFSHGNLYNLHLLSSSSPSKTWLSTRNRIFSSRMIPLWWQKFSRIERALILITWNLGKCGDIYTSKNFSNEPGFWRRGPSWLVTYAT